jgi:alkanesulfonate monooxygenase SsuD/methylene tetrahydromethanopterin reductase-like flavin-dependent oxidoreductase (luciferase family)
MEQIGRKPDDCKVLFIASPIVGETEAEAREKQKRWTTDDNFVEYMLAEISSITEIDFSQFPLDEPLPELTTNGERGALESFVGKGRDKTLRELASGGFSDSVAGMPSLVGTPDQVAETMGEMMEEAGGDGFLIFSPVMRLSRRYITEITDGLVPALQRRGLTRTEYAYDTLRENLLDF